MNKNLLILVQFTSFILLSVNVLSQEVPKIVQEEESTEVFLEEYTDEFQDTFFEALKQKGIQNYDRAINLLLKCKQLEVSHNAVNHELAKVHFLDKKYIPAQQYATEALIAEPGNYWILASLLEIMEKQGIPFQSVHSTIPYENKDLRANLAKIYFSKKKYKEAKQVLEELETNPKNTLLLQKIHDSLQFTKSVDTIAEKVKDDNKPLEEPVTNELENLRAILNTLMLQNNAEALEKKTAEALENYPLQPEFYFYHGLALNNQEKWDDAIAVLEEGLNYLLDNAELESAMYKELAKAYKAKGNDSKANSYLSRVKPGFQ